MDHLPDTSYPIIFLGGLMTSEIIYVPRQVTQTFIERVRFVREFPKNVPVYITCAFPNHGEVDMLVIPQYYHAGTFRCSVLAINAPLIPKGYCPSWSCYEEVPINIELIKSWGLWRKSDGFLTFGNGYITDRYLNMIFN